MANSISGSMGVAGATIVAVGYASGTVASATADGSGNYTISALPNDTYYLTPALAGFVFSPYVSKQVISGSNITGVNFTGTAFVPTGVWTKYGDVNLITPASAQGSFLGGTQPGAVLYEGNAQILSGNVFKTWYMDGSNTRYAESTDGKTWSIRAGNIVANFLWPTIFKHLGTYYLFGIPSAGSTSALYTSSDGVTFTLQNASVLVAGGAGTWDSGGIFQLTVADIISGTWYALYTGFAVIGGKNVGAVGLATSPDGINWTKYLGTGGPVIINGSAQCSVKVNGTYYVWLNWVPYDKSIGTAYALGQPTDIWRIQSNDLINWSNAVPSLPRSFLGEGVSVVDGQTGNPWLVVGTNSVYMFYFGSNRAAGGDPATNFKFMLATSSIGIAQLVASNEGILSSPQLAIDMFNRADENPLAGGTNWGVLTGTGEFGALKLASGLVQPISTSTWGLEVYKGIVWPNDQYAECILNANTGTTRFNLLQIRAAAGATGQNNYVILCANANLGVSQQMNIQKNVNGAGTSLSTFTATPRVFDVWRLEAKGTTLNAYQNGVLVSTVVDATFASGQPGMQMFNDTATASSSISAWEGGNASAAGLPAIPNGVIPNAIVDTINNGACRPVIIYGRAPNGVLSAVTTDGNGNIDLSGQTPSTVDIIGNSICTPVMIYGRAPNGQLQAVTTDGDGQLS